MPKHQVSELIVISSLIRFSHLLLYAQTLEGKSDTRGCGETVGGMGWRGGEKEMHTTPLLFKNIYIIDKAWLLQGGTIGTLILHISSMSNHHRQQHWQLYPNQFTKHTGAR